MRLHHVQVCCPRGGEADARRFYGEGLGMTEVEKPAELAGRGGAWFRAYDDEGGSPRSCTSASRSRSRRPARRTRRCVLPSHEACWRRSWRGWSGWGIDVDRSEWDTFPGYRRVHVNDGPGNRVELLALTCTGRRSNRNRPVDSTLSRRGPSLEPVVFLGGSGAGVTQADAPTSTGATQVVNRIKRAQGQLSGVLRMLEEGRDLQEIVNQLKAVSRALDRAGFAIIATELRESARKGAVSEDELDQLERFFLSLA